MIYERNMHGKGHEVIVGGNRSKPRYGHKVNYNMASCSREL